MNRNVFVIVSLVAITILGGLALALALVANDDSDGVGAEPTPGTGPGFDGIPFVDPQGAYRVDIGPAWRADPEPPAPDVESWAVDATSGPSADRVDVETSTVDEVDLDQYLQRVIEQAPERVDDFKLREFRVVTIDGSDPSAPPTRLGVVAYEGTRGATPIAYFLVVSVETGNAVVATLTTQHHRFDAARAEVEPYLMTLQQT